MRALRLLAPVLALAFVSPQSATAQKPGSLMADLMSDVAEVEKKMVDLAKAIPADKFGYRPSAGTRTVGEVVMHVASDNYFFGAVTGTAAPAATGIKPEDYKTVTGFEARKVTPAEAANQLQASFTFLKQVMAAQSEASMTQKKSMFGQEFTGQRMWVMATTHLHEHLGQLIAYARANNITPPWSR